jgi:hypothetical protein
MQDIYGTPLPEAMWHGSTSDVFPDVVAPAADVRGWWNVMDHGEYLDPPFLGDDADQRAELDAEVRTAYGNAVYEAFRTSDNPELRRMAKEVGLEGLGREVGILFATGDQSYAGQYGSVVEVDLESEGILAVIPDENIIEERQSWLLVLRAGAPFPFGPKGEDPAPTR